jgi:putative Flp pilus-assembly TadE/G-like protein
VRVTGRIRPNDERGVSLVIVALALVAIFAMVVLTVDVGVLLVKRRTMVRASDAAALAAAQSCARDLAGEAEAKADEFAGLNAQGVLTGGIIAGAGCQDGYVTVRYSVDQQTFFAPVLGFGNSEDVAAEATAAWAPSGAANPLPIVLNLATFQGDCEIPNIAKGTKCYLWYDNDRFDGSNFGFLNLEQWDVDSGAHCSNAGTDQRRDWILGDWDGDPLPIHFPEPTYVCTDSGISSSSWATLEDRIGDDLTFPINRTSGQLMGNGGQIEKYDIIGFATMNLTAILTVQQAQAGGGGCSVTRNFPNASPVTLDQLGTADGCFAAPPDSVSTPTLTNANKKDPPCCTEGVHYTYDAGTRTITWIFGQSREVDIDFTWNNDGPCGAPPVNSSARCIIVEWVGHRFGGTQPCSGCQDFGLESIRLCELDIQGSCPEAD